MKKILMIGGASVALLACILFGAFFAGPLMASAHTDSTVAATSTTKTPKTKATDAYCTQYEQDLAKKLNVSVETLKQDRQGALSDVLAQMVKDGKLTQSEANAINARVAANKSCTGFHAKSEQNAVRKAFLKKYRAAIESSIASGLHLSVDQLKAQLKAGKSLQQIATTQKVSNVQQIVVNAVDSAIDKAAKAGDITQQQASAYKQYVSKHATLVARIVDVHKKVKK